VSDSTTPEEFRYSHPNAIPIISQEDTTDEEEHEETPQKTDLHLIAQLALHLPIIAGLLASSQTPQEYKTANVMYRSSGKWVCRIHAITSR
jgi:hypothetical protein